MPVQNSIFHGSRHVLSHVFEHRDTGSQFSVSTQQSAKHLRDASLEIKAIVAERPRQLETWHFWDTHTRRLPNGLRVRFITQDPDTTNMTEYRRTEQNQILRALARKREYPIVVVGYSGAGKSTTTAAAVKEYHEQTGKTVVAMEYGHLGADTGGADIINLTLLNPRDHTAIASALGAKGITTSYTTIFFDYKPLSRAQQDEMRSHHKFVSSIVLDNKDYYFPATTVWSVGSRPYKPDLNDRELEKLGKPLAENLSFPIKTKYPKTFVALNDSQPTLVSLQYLNERHLLDYREDLKAQNGVILSNIFDDAEANFPLLSNFYSLYQSGQWIDAFLKTMGIATANAGNKFVKNLYLAETRLPDGSGTAFARNGFKNPDQAVAALRIYALASLLYSGPGFDLKTTLQKAALGQPLPSEIYQNPELMARYRGKSLRQDSRNEDIETFITNLWDEVADQYPALLEDPMFQFLETGVD